MLGQLAEGVNALHQAGKLHCDLKPSNVLIDDRGRLVILDFGLVTSSDAAEIFAQGQSIAGTPQYMSPEQVSGSRLSAASDWYSVGVMLFEALTGQRLFKGSLREVIEQKWQPHPPAPDDVIKNLPSDLTELCCSLLVRDPVNRPRGIDILQFLGIKYPRPNMSLLMRTDPRAPFIGRKSELSILRDCFRQAEQNQMVTVLVHGPSGMGKTALVQQFLSELRRADEQVILEGRCSACS